ncbi:protein of unknown function [Paraburkholderia kururiensis]
MLDTRVSFCVGFATCGAPAEPLSLRFDGAPGASPFAAPAAVFAVFFNATFAAAFIEVFAAVLPAVRAARVARAAFPAA